ncbi:competence protein ComEA [Actinacidiphila rubida]|uniref:Competence protein ComEA n=2 Tax=Actinacidiphila rubida TaxID=310780 RepID=A0A1H8F398_9ACTN|nr:ComEA family DNA-binding protein [Actinacidiphila rubida]SEN26212.1 competence protein ComEA [Actinacidiphila rubida]
MNLQSVIDSRDKTTSGPPGPDRAALTRERATALFGRTAPPAPLPPPPPPRGERRLAEPLPGVPVFGEGPVGRVRAWLFVRCGLEFRTVLALAVILLAALGLAFQHYWSGRPRTLHVPPPVPAAAVITPAPVTVPLPSAAPTGVTVDVAGKVARPGLRRLPKGSRVADALTAAGGPLPGADTTALNLARPLADGEQILVGLPAPAPAATTGTATAPLSLNSATPAQLDALPGVGPVLAQHIIDFRTQHGAFTSLQQLRQIPGIGPRKFTTLQPLVHP